MSTKLHYPPDLQKYGFALSLGVSSIFLILLGLTNEITLIAAAGGLAVALASVNARYRMILLVALVPLAHAGFGLPGLKGFGFFDMYAALFILVFLWGTVVLRRFAIQSVPVMPFAFIMALVFVPSIVNSASMLESAKAFVQLIFSILLGISFFSYLKREDERYRKALLMLFVVVATMASLYGLYEASRASILRVMTGRAFFTLFGDVNYYASFLLMAEAIALGFLLISKKLMSRLFFGIASLILSIAIVSTVSRSALAVLILVWLAFLGFLFFQEKGARKYVGPAVAVTVISLVGILLVTDVGSKVVDLFTLTRRVESVVGGKDASVDQRFTILGIGWDIVQDNPWIGVGFGAFEKTFDRYQQGKLSTGFGRSAHNTYLRILAETGIVGFLASLIFFVSLVRYLWKGLIAASQKEEKTLLFALFISIGSFLVMSATLDQLFEPHFWIILAIGFVYSRDILTRTSPDPQGSLTHG